MIKLYNTLTKQIDEFTPLRDNTVRMYSCGPTVYNHAHIGNLSSFIYADLLRRMLQASGLQVKHTMNLTDVDDKTIKRSLEEDHSEEPKTALLNLTSRYSDLFLDDMKALGNNISALTLIKATDHIEEMQSIIQNLVAENIAYIADDGVYFSIAAYRAKGKTYGQLVTLSNEESSESRIDNDEYDKESAHDFALWKKRKENEPYWPFTLDGHELDGRPGWHIECSAMSQATLDLPFDIHTGGIDLMFPHHENEIAQSTATSDHDQMAQFFVHSEHLLVEGKKMSKSLDNFFTLEDVRARSIDPLAFRLHTLQSHYRSQSNFTWEGIEASQTILRDIQAWADLRFQNLTCESLKTDYAAMLPAVQAALQQDLNTPEALGQLIHMIKRAGEIGADSDTIQEILPLIELLFGLDLLNRQDINQPQKELLSARGQARDSKDWTKSDQLRDQLKAEGILVRDSSQGQIWERI